MAKGMFSGFVFGAMVGLAAFAVWSLNVPLPAPAVPHMSPERADPPMRDSAPVLPSS